MHGETYLIWGLSYKSDVSGFKANANSVLYAKVQFCNSQNEQSAAAT